MGSDDRSRHASAACVAAGLARCFHDRRQAHFDGKLGREAALERNRERIIDDLMRREFGAGDEAIGPVRGKSRVGGESREFGKCLRGKPGASHARKATACHGAPARHIPEPMAGAPIKRQRKLGVRCEDGSIITFPHMPRVAELPRGWRNFGPAQKVEHLLNMSLDRASEILSWELVTDLDAQRLHVRLQVWRVVFMIRVKALLNGKLDREVAFDRNRQRLPEEIERDLAASEVVAPRT